MKNELTPENTKFVKSFTYPRIGKYNGTMSGNTARWFGVEGIWETVFDFYVKGIDCPCVIIIHPDCTVSVEFPKSA